MDIRDYAQLEARNPASVGGVSEMYERDVPDLLSREYEEYVARELEDLEA